MKSIDSHFDKIVYEAVYNPSLNQYFELNLEFIDAKKRFRLIDYDNSKYVIKIANTQAAKEEVTKAKIASEKLTDAVVSGMHLEVVVPKEIELENGVALVTPYLGQTLQGKLYTGENNDFSFELFQSLLIFFKECGILFRGLLPRNIVFKNETIFLIDWEDTTFFSDYNYKINTRWETNIILNWGYFFNTNEVERVIKSIYSSCEREEPELVEYEQILCEIEGWDSTDIQSTRLKIKQLVLSAESPVCNVRYTGIPPHDCAHLIADYFSDQIDVLFDVIMDCLVKHNETLRIYVLEYISWLVRNVECASVVRIEILAILFFAIDNLYNTNPQVNFNHMKTLSKMLSTVLNNKYEDFQDNLCTSLNNFFVNEKFELEGTFIDDTSTYVYSMFQAYEDYGKIVYISHSWIVAQARKYENIPGCYEILFKKNKPISPSDIYEYALILKGIRAAYADCNIRLTGIYSEPLGRHFSLTIPFYLSVLKQLDIDPEKYQPEIHKYLENFSSPDCLFSNYDIDMCVNKRLEKIGEYNDSGLH